MLKLLMIFSIFIITTSIYSYSINTVDGNPISLNDFRDKKILLVNIATGSSKVNQLQRLEQLYQLYKDSLVIIAFPSNSFGNETKTNQEIKTYCNDSLQLHFLIAEKNEVAGDSIQPLFDWLSKKDENGTASVYIKGDFQKFLIDRNGKLVGVFETFLDPMSSAIQNEIIHN